MSLTIFFGLVPLIRSLLHREDAIEKLIHPDSQLFAWFYVLNWHRVFRPGVALPLYIVHFWSLAVEEQFYLGWPLVVRLLTRRRLTALCLVLVAGSFALRLWLTSRGAVGSAFGLTFCRMDSLAIGGLIALAIRNDRYWSLARRLALPIMLAAAAGILLIVARTGRVTFTTPAMTSYGVSLLGLLFGGLLVTALNAAPGSALHRVASAPTLRFFGKYSYCMYVCHQPLILVLAPLGLNVGHLSRVLGNMVVAVVVMNGVALLLTVLVSLISWNLFEKHFLKLKDRFPVGPAPAPLTQPAA